MTDVSNVCLYIVQKVQKTKKKQVCPNVDWWCMSFNFEPGLWGSLGKSFNRLQATTLWNIYQVTITLLNVFWKNCHLSQQQKVTLSWVETDHDQLFCVIVVEWKKAAAKDSNIGDNKAKITSSYCRYLCVYMSCDYFFFFFKMHTPCLEAND